MTTAERIARQNNQQQNQRRTQQKQQPRQQQPRQQQKQNNNKQQSKRKGSLLNKLLFFLIALGIVGGVKDYPYSIDNKTVLELTEANANHSYFDDVLALDETITIYDVNGNVVGDIQLEEAIKMLENYFQIAEVVDGLDLSEKDYNEMTDDEKAEAIAEYNENGLESLIRKYKNSNNTDIEKARFARKIKCVSEYLGTGWLDANGVNVARQLMNKVVQAGVVEAYGGLLPGEYSYAQIGDEHDFPYHHVHMHDGVSGEEDTLHFAPIFAGEYTEGLHVAEKLNSTDEKSLTPAKRLKLIEKAITTAKRCINKDLDSISLGPVDIAYTHKR